MTLWTLIRRSLRFHWRAHLGVVLGAAVGSAALIGALIVGDSVRESLRERAMERIGWVDAAMAPTERFFVESWAKSWTTHWRSSYLQEAIALHLPATISRQDGGARANQIHVLGVRADFWTGRNNATNDAVPPGSVLLNPALAAQLNARPGDEVILRLHKPSALSRDMPVSPQNDASVALRMKVHGIAPPETLGNFSLRASQVPPLNAFVSLDELATAAGLPGKANVMLAGLAGAREMRGRSLVRDVLPGESLRWHERFLLDWLNVAPSRVRRMVEDGPRSRALAGTMNALVTRSNVLSHFEVELSSVAGGRELELHTPRIFLNPPVVRAALVSHTPVEVLTYLVNQLRFGTNATPYSMVTAAGPPYTPAGMRDDEVIINQWLADDLRVKEGDEIALIYFLADSASSLAEATNTFRVRSIVPMTMPHSDPTLMPEFPGIAKAESTRDWDAGFKLTHKIRDQDDKYWKQWRGTPKAFVTPAAGQRMWANRFGSLTALRFPVPTAMKPDDFQASLAQTILSSLDRAELGLRFEPVREQALAAAEQSQDFGGLFLGFSFFLIAAALILMALLFQFGLEQRSAEVGTLLALGFTPKRARKLLLLEGTALAFFGGMLGVLGGAAYARAMLHGLTTVWRDAVGTSALEFHATPTTLVLGLAASVVVSAVTIALVLRKQARRPARELLAGGADSESEVSNVKLPKRRPAMWIAWGAGIAALGAVAWAMATGKTASAEVFFSAGSLLLISGLAGTSVWLGVLARSAAAGQLSLGALGLRGATRRRKRSLAVVGLLACGSFLIAAIGAFRLDANQDAHQRSSGTGGFALIGEAALPVVQDLNRAAGREFFGLDAKDLSGVNVVPLRVRDGDDASCLNLNRAQKPRLLGVKPELMPHDAFTFTKTMPGAEAKSSQWSILSRTSVPDRIALEQNEIAAIGDAASIQWALHKSVGDTLDFVDERGQPFKVRLVAALANSILQGSLLIAEDELLKRFPSESGYRMLLIDAPSNAVPQVSATLTRALEDAGLELTPAPRRLAQFNAVQNTYLNTFQVLGGLGLLLGSVGLGVVVLRNVLERRGELAVLQAVGFRRRSLQWLVLSEHGGLLWIGLTVGVGSALVAILPVLLAPGAEIHWLPLVATLVSVLASGVAWTWVATWIALRGKLLEALRSE